MGLQQLRRQEVAEMGRLVPADVQVVNVDHAKAAHHVELQNKKISHYEKENNTE